MAPTTISTMGCRWHTGESLRVLDAPVDADSATYFVVWYTRRDCIGLMDIGGGKTPMDSGGILIVQSHHIML